MSRFVWYFIEVPTFAFTFRNRLIIFINTFYKFHSLSKDSEEDTDNLIEESLELHKALRDGTYGKHLNVLLVGMTGVGKSSFVNRYHHVLSCIIILSYPILFRKITLI